ncbi:golgin subfamily B member 1-like isoform X2 [Stegostoma tigrinum]|uniref:golgin subfamily B member 1-like isoform X2 n=1 Tax=Stegostoma tigrinum TaxID=3053191 RepID=UPI00286FECE6|nr:golgin subfamily B member 1-like isoform X2 [Stegostoma tigrinum]
MDNADNTEGENLGGLRTVVEELELERNRLQEQILMLEERCQDLEEKAQLRTRVEFHQSESERLQNQLSLVRCQQSRDSEQHHNLITNLNEQLKEVSDKKDFLENSLVEKDKLLAETSAKLLQMDNLKESLEAQKIINQDLTVKLSQTEENVQKQEVAMEVLHQDLDQANDELERLNSIHLEERARLIDDLQSCEREIDLLKETIAEKAHKLTDLSKTVAEYSEHSKILKEQNKCKEQEVEELKAALEKVEMEIMLLKKTQTVDEQTMKASISALVDQLSQMESELSNARSDNETKGKEIASLLKQIGENNNTIQGLHSELQKQKISNKAHLVDCSAQISFLENKIIIATQQLQETNAANQEEIESLKVQLIESNLTRARLDSSLREKEEKEQCLENELKTLKNQCNNLIADTVGKEEELTKLSKKFAEHKEEAEIRLQEKLEHVASLESRLQAIQETNSQFVQEIQAKEAERQDLKRQVDEMTKLFTDSQRQTQKLNETNVQLQATVKEQVQSLSEQAKLLSESNERVAHTLEIQLNLEHQLKELNVKNENLKEIVNSKEDELLKKNDVVKQLEKGIASKEEHISLYISTVSELQKHKESVVPKLELLKTLEQKELTLEKQLREKINECNLLKDQILENQKSTEQVRGQLQSLTVQLGELRLLHAEKEDLLNSKITECISLQNQLRERQETLMRLQDQIQDSNIELGVKDVALKQKLSECSDLQKTLSQQQLTAKSLESQIHALTEERENLRQLFESRESLLSNKSNECHALQEQLDQKADTIVFLQKQMETLTVDKKCLQSENEELQISLSKWTAEQSQLLEKINDCESVAALAQDQAKILVTENQKLKEHLENVNSTLCSKTDEVTALQSLLSQKVEMITSMNENDCTCDVSNGKFTLNLEGKQIAPNQQTILLQQEQGEVLQEDSQMSQYVQIISHLQARVQIITSETAQLKQTLQEKETALQQKAYLDGELQKMTAEHEALKLQSVENTGIILKLQNQIRDMTSKTNELKCNIEERDKLLACKVEECVKIKATFSETEDTVSQFREQLAAVSAEAELLRMTIQEKEMIVQQIKESTTICNEALMLKIQTKETEYTELNEKFNNLEHLFSQCNNQMNQQKSEISQLKQDLVQKEASILEERKLVRKWQDRASECDFLKLEFTESTKKVSRLQSEVQYLMSESKRLEELLQEKETAFSHLQERYAAQTEQFEEFSEMLHVKEQEITELQAALCAKDASIQVIESNANAFMIEVKSLKEELQKSQVSLTNCKDVLQQKVETFAISQRNMESQIVTLEAQKIQYKEAAEHLDMINQDLKQNELILQKKYLDQTHHIEKLDSKLKALSEKSAQDYQDKTALVEHLYQQCDQLKKENSQLDHQIEMMKIEKEQVSASYQQKVNELQVLEEKLATMCDIKEKLDVTQRMKDENESLQNQVSVKSEQITKLKVEIKKLEQNLTESERKSFEFGRETEKNNLLTEKLNNLANQLELKDVKIDSLQKALDNLQEKLGEQSSVIKTSSNRLKEQEVLASNFSQQIIEKQSKLDELSAFVLSTESAVVELKQILSEKEKEIENLQSRISESEKQSSEITGSLGNKLKSFEEEKLSLCNELKQTKLSHRLELEALQRQVADLQEIQPQAILREKQPFLDESVQQNNSTKEQTSTLEDTVKEEAQHFDSLQKKEQAAHLLTLQVNQHQEMVISLSQQLREKEATTMQLTESISKEMVKAAEEKTHLAGQIQELKVQHHVSNEKVEKLTDELAKYKKQLEEQEIILNTKEIQYEDIVAKNEQLLSQTEVLTKERDILKKKFQAALITRRDLMKKVQELQKGAIAEKEKDQQITEMQHNYRMLESQTQELTSEMTISQKQIKQLESHLEALKQQLVEKDSDINILSETLSKKETDIEQLERKFSKYEMEKEAMSAEFLQIIQKKDSSIARLQAVLKDREIAFEDERIQLNSDLEKMKISLPKQTECSSIESSGRNVNPGNGNIDFIEPLNVLKQEKEHLQKKLQAALLARKEAIKKVHEEDKNHKEQLSLQKEEYNLISEMYSVQTKEFENVKEELAALLQTHQTKLMEFECNRELTGTLQKQLQSVTVMLNDKERALEQLKAQLEEQESKMLAALSQQDEVQILEKKLTSMVSSLAVKDTDLKNLQRENNQLQQELGRAQAKIIESSEETQMVKHSLTSLKHQYQEEKERQAAENNWLQNELRSIQAEAESLKIALEGALKDKENCCQTLENSAKDLTCLKTQLLNLHREKDKIQAQLNIFQGENAEVKSILQQASQSQKADEEKLHTQILPVQSERAKMYERLQEQDNAEETLECTLSAKEKPVEELGLQVQKQLFYETEKERGKISTTEVQRKAVGNPEECTSKELIQRKLQAALISRKEALKENKTLKHNINALTSEKEVLISKISTLERSLVEIKKQLESLQQVISAHHEEKTMLLSEVDEIFAVKQNLNVANESLKRTLETITEEKQDLSHQLDSLKNSQATELSELKAKHDELKHEYESLLQSYENIGNEMYKMRQIVETTRKEKQEIVYNFREVEAKRQRIEKQLEEVSDQNEKTKDKMRKLAKSKQQRVQELEDEIERISTELQAISANQSHTNELSVQCNQLREENKLLKQTYEKLKSEFNKTQKENEHLLKELNTSTSIFDELQAKESFHQSKGSKIDNKSQINEPLSPGKQILESEDGTFQRAKQTRPLLTEKLQQLKLSHKEESQEEEGTVTELQQIVKACQDEIVNLNEKVKILEDDKSLLQEELENIQEMSDKVKNEKEHLEAELLKNAGKLDQLTDALKTLHVQNNSLSNELDSFRQEKCQLVNAKEAQETELAKVFEEKLRSARSDKARSSGETKQLQELLKEKQQEINQLQKDCIKYQELILDLERSIKASDSACEEMQNRLECATTKVFKSEEQVRIVQEELASNKVLLLNSKSEADGVHAQCLELMKKLQKQEEKAKAQITEKEKKLLLILDQQKTIHQKEIVSYQDKLDLMERDKDRVVAELLEVQAEQNGRDLLIKKLQDELNSNLANLAAFAKCMSSLQDDRDRIIEESKEWESRFKDTIQNKEHQVQAKEEMLQKLNEQIKLKSFDLQELQHRSLKLEQTINELTLSSKNAEVKHQNELENMTELICKHSEKLEEMERLLKEKEATLSKLLQENNDLSTQLSDMSHSVTKLKITEQMLEKNLAEKQSESHQLLSENEKLNADLEKQNAISQQLKLMLNNKDMEISKLISSKEGEISEYVAELQEQYRTQMEVYKHKLKVFQHDSHKAANEIKELQVQIDKNRKDKDKAIAKTDAFTKSMASLQDDRDRILTEYTQLEQRHLDMLSQKDGLIQDSATENNKLKQEIRNLLNQMDDLNSENAMLRAQLIQYREELNQVLCLKDNQLKELLQKQLQQIKNLETDKNNFEEQWKEAQKSLEKCNESIRSLQVENKQLMGQMMELKTVPLRTQDKSEANELKKDFDFKTTIVEEHENKLFEVESLTKSETVFKISEKAVEIVQEGTQEELVGSSNDLLKMTVCLKDQNLCQNSSEIIWLRNKIEELEKLHQAKLQEHTEQDVSSFQNELAELRSEKSLVLSESTATKEQYLLKVVDRDRQITDLRKLNQEAWNHELANSVQQTKPLEIESLLSSENNTEQVKFLLMEKKQLQSEAQGYLQEIHRKEQEFQKLNSKIIQSIEERSTLSNQLKVVCQTLRDTQSRYGDLQDRYYQLERRYQAMRSLPNEEQNEANEEVPPGAPQERASVIVEIDNLELSELRRRLAESDQRNDSAHHELSQLTEMLAHEELRRRAAEEALIAAEEILKGLDITAVRQTPREYTIQLESDEEREALFIDPSEQVVVRKVKRGALSFKRWLRSRSLYCSKIMSSRARTRYLVFVYFVTLHVLVFMCLTGFL